MKEKIFSVAKYSMIGVIGTALDVGILAFLVEYLNIKLAIAVAVAFMLAALNNFLLNKWWTFRNPSKDYFYQYIRFLLVSIVGFVLTMLLMSIFVSSLGLWYIFSKLLTSLIVLVWNFLANYNWTFREYTKVKLDENYLYDYSIIIPAYNESKRIVKTLESIHLFFQKNKSQNTYEIIVVNDGSSDNTIEVIDSRNKLISFTKNQGKGKAVRTGVLQSRGRYILYMDADGATDISELNSLDVHMSSHDMVIGSRMDKSKIGQIQPVNRKILGKLRKVFTFLLLDDVVDTQCGFKLMHAPVAYNIFNKITIDRFGFDVELLVLAKLNAYKIKEVPIHWNHIGQSQVRFMKDSVYSLKDMLFIYFNLFTGRYR